MPSSSTHLGFPHGHTNTNDSCTDPWRWSWEWSEKPREHDYWQFRPKGHALLVPPRQYGQQSEARFKASWSLLSTCLYLFPWCDWYPPDAVHIGWVSIGEARRGEVATALLQTVPTSCLHKENTNPHVKPGVLSKMHRQLVSAWKHLISH